MTIDYEVIKNQLTVPPTYTTRVAPKSVLGFNEVAEQINLHNPNMPVASILAVLTAFQDEVKIQLLDGNTVKLENFVSFVATMPNRLDVATDPLPSQPLDIRAKPSAPFKEAIRNEASFNRVGYPVKEPSIISIIDTNTEFADTIRENYGLKIIGTNVGNFDTSDSDLGVYVTGADGTIAKQTNISVNDPSSVIVVAAPPAYGAYNQVENTVEVRNRFTANGLVKTGEYERKVRGIVEIDITGGDKDIMSRGVAAGCFKISAASAALQGAVVRAVMNTDNIVELSLADSMTAAFGVPVLCYSDDALFTTYQIFNAAGTQSVTLEQQGAAVVYATVTAYQRLITEVVNITL